MTTPEGIAFGSLVLGFLGFIYKFGNDEQGKRARIYTRIDEVKKDFEVKTQTKEICNIHVETLNNTLAEIRDDVKTLLNNGKGK